MIYGIYVHSKADKMASLV